MTELGASLDPVEMLRYEFEVLVRVPASLAKCNIYKPRGQFTYQPGTTPTRVLNLMAPGGFEQYLKEAARAMPTDGPPDPLVMAEIASRRGLILLEDCAQAHFATLGGRKVAFAHQVAQHIDGQRLTLRQRVDHHRHPRAQPTQLAAGHIGQVS